MPHFHYGDAPFPTVTDSFPFIPHLLSRKATARPGGGRHGGPGRPRRKPHAALPRHSSLVFSPRGLKVNFPENLKPSAHSLPDTSRASAGSLDFLPLRLHPVSVSLDFRPEPGTYLGFGVHRARDIWHARVTGGD